MINSVAENKEHRQGDGHENGEVDPKGPEKRIPVEIDNLVNLETQGYQDHRDAEVEKQLENF